MKGSALASLASGQWSPRRIVWIGGVFIAIIIATAVYDLVRAYRETVRNTERELSSHARVIAEQTARSFQAVDVQLRHLAQQFRQGMLSPLSPADLRTYLQEQAVGLVQVQGLLIIDSSGRLRATSYLSPLQESELRIADTDVFGVLSANRDLGLVIGSARKSKVDGQWMFPTGRRIETQGGEFAGIVAARSRIEYFQQFYRDIRLDEGTSVALMNRDGTLLARHPPVESMFGKPIALSAGVAEAVKAVRPALARTVSPLDGVERFVALQPVPDHSLTVFVTRDAAVALAPWREQSAGTAARTLALGALATLLLWLAARQLARLQQTQQSLKASQERFAVAVAGSDDGIWDLDFVTRTAFNSARGRELVGMPPYPETEPLDDWLAKLPTYLHPEDISRRKQAMESHLAGRTPTYEVEVRHRQPDGTYRWVRVRGICIRDADGKPIRMAGSASDIDARKRAEEALRESEERFALAVAGSNDGIVDWDIVNDRMYMSPRALEIVGIASDVAIRPRAEWRDLLKYHPEDAPRVRDEVVAFLAGSAETRDAEYRVLLPSGEYRWIRHRNKCIRNARGEPTRLSGSVSDVDARKKAEAALRESQERYQLAVAGANQGLWDWDLASDMMFLSVRAQEFMGLTPKESLRSRRDWIALCSYHPDDVAATRAAVAAHLGGQTPFFAAEYRLRHASGAWHWYRQRGLALRNDSGKPYRMAGSMEDITEYKNAEADRARLEGQLLQSKKLEAIGTLAGGIAHDFNNILAAILGYGEMALKSAAEGTALRRHVDAVVSAGMRAKSLVERILAFSRSGVGERVPVHVKSVVAEALDLVAASLPGHVRLERRLDAGDAAVVGDPTQIHQVVMNLCANAAQAMKSTGAITVSLDVVEKGGSMAATSALASGRYVRLSVRDTGTGIPPQVLERIFDPFFTTKEVGVGTGLGLSLVHGIVTDLGGGIDVDSRPGEGATFTVYLPWSSSAAVPAPIEESLPNGTGETILLVDDEEVLVRLGEEMIATLGYEPVGFTSSSAALDAFRASPGRFNAVLSDESMPEMTGSELARAIRAIRADLPIVLMSGVVSPALSARAREIGVIDVIAKPLVSRDIARSLATALRSEQGSRRFDGN
jgi:PAS domain S-box-containing protein